jgi:hypothetical protein
MCMGSSPKPLPPPAQAVSSTTVTPTLETDMYDDPTAASENNKKRRGKKSLRIKRGDSALNIPGAGTGESGGN